MGIVTNCLINLNILFLCLMVKCGINHWIDALIGHFKNDIVDFEFRNRMMKSRAIICYRNSSKYFFPPEKIAISFSCYASHIRTRLMGDMTEITRVVEWLINVEKHFETAAILINYSGIFFLCSLRSLFACFVCYFFFRKHQMCCV